MKFGLQLRQKLHNSPQVTGMVSFMKMTFNNENDFIAK